MPAEPRSHIASDTDCHAWLLPGSRISPPQAPLSPLRSSRRRRGRCAAAVPARCGPSARRLALRAIHDDKRRLMTDRAARSFSAKGNSPPPRPVSPDAAAISSAPSQLAGRWIRPRRRLCARSDSAPDWASVRRAAVLRASPPDHSQGRPQCRGPVCLLLSVSCGSFAAEAGVKSPAVSSRLGREDWLLG